MKTAPKKGSLSLSVNAIVVLVLALTMLGLGISFTKNMFGTFNLPKIDLPDASREDPIVLNSDMKLSVSKTTGFQLKIYNTGDQTQSKDSPPKIKCLIGDNKNSNAVPVDLILLMSDISAGGQKEFEVKAPKATDLVGGVGAIVPKAGNTGTCEIWIEQPGEGDTVIVVAQKQFPITVVD